MSRADEIVHAAPNSGDYSTMTTADKLSHTHLNLLKVAWQKDHDDLQLHKDAVDQLREELSNLCSLTDLQTIRGDLGILFTNNTENPHSFVDAIERSLPREYMEAIRLRCCIRSGDSWIIIGSDNPVQRLKDTAFDNAVSSMAANNIYHLKQLASSSVDNKNILGGDGSGVCVLPVFPMVCFWLLESEIARREGLQNFKSRRFVSMIPNSPSGFHRRNGGNGNGINGEDRDLIDNTDDEGEGVYRAAVFLTGGFYPVLEAASQFCMSSLVHHLEGQQLDATVSTIYVYVSVRSKALPSYQLQ